jgi:hypothetical protein
LGIVDDREVSSVLEWIDRERDQRNLGRMIDVELAELDFEAEGGCE